MWPNRGEERGVYNLYSFFSQRVQSHLSICRIVIYNTEHIFPRYLTRNLADGSYSIPKAESHAEVATTCLSYLRFRCFDSDITNDDVDGFIGGGEYVLHQYSQSNFLHHVRGAWRNAGEANKIPNVRTSTKKFLKARWNPSFRPADSELSSSSSEPGHIQPTDAEVYERLNTIAARLRARDLTESTKGLSPVYLGYRLLDSMLTSSRKQTWAKSRCYWPSSPAVSRNVSTYWPRDSAQEDIVAALLCITITERNCSVVLFLPAAATDTALRLATNGRPTPQSINGRSNVV